MLRVLKELESGMMKTKGLLWELGCCLSELWVVLVA